MRKNKSKDILYYFIKHDKENLTIQTLSEKFGVSNRQIKNYIKQINQEVEPFEMIQNNNNSYSLNPSYKEHMDTFDQPEFSSKERVANIISKLITMDNVNIFDIADELFVSRPTIESDLKKVRKQIESFHLELQMKEDELTLIGTEKNKRKLASYMLTNTEYKGFMVDGSNQFLNGSYQIDFIKEHVIKIFNECNFVFNDYSLNNIILHLIITIDRLGNDYHIEESNPSLSTTHVEIEATEGISKFLQEEFNIYLTDKEKSNMAIFLSCNLATVDYKTVHSKNIDTFINNKSKELANKIIEEVVDFYYLDAFDDIFMARFFLHIDNLLKRCSSNFSAHNPMAKEIQLSYPLIYDIAVYAANIIHEETGYMINQDEISLIALHIGNFIESNNQNKNKVTAVYVYADYYGFYQRNIATLQNRFNDKMNLKYSISYLDYKDSSIDTDLIISEVNIDGAIIVPPFIKDTQITQVQNRIQALLDHKEMETFNNSLKDLFTKDLFYTNIYGENEFEVIEKLGNEIKPKGYFDQEFIDAVYKRERMSSTCFVEKIAIPHGISHQVSKSFISFVCYDQKQLWGNNYISLVVLIGIAYPDRKIFRSVFNHLITLFENEASINAISKCKTYEEVLDTINNLMKK